MTRPAFYGCNDNQNFFLDDKTTTRVVAAPGGHSSIDLRWDDENENENAKVNKCVASSINLRWDGHEGTSRKTADKE